MHYIDVCIIDDDIALEGWRLLVLPLEVGGFIMREKNSDASKSDNLSKLVVDYQHDFILCYTKVVGHEFEDVPFKGIRLHVLTSGDPVLDLDYVLQKALELDADIYIIDINLKYIKPGKKIDNAAIAGTVIKQRLKEDKFKIVYSAKNEDNVILTGDDMHTKSIFLATINNGAVIIQQLVEYLTRVQAEKIRTLSLPHRQELITLAKSIGNSSISDVADLETKSGWSLRTLFPQQINATTANILPDEELENKKNEILTLLELNFRRAFSRFFSHRDNQLLLELLCDLDFAAGKKNDTDPIDFTPIGKLVNKNMPLPQIRSTLGYQAYNQLESQLQIFFSQRKSPGTSLSVELRNLEKESVKAMVEKFGIHSEHFLYIMKIAVMNIITHQTDSGDTEHRLRIQASYPPDNSLQIDITAGASIGRRVIYDQPTNTVGFFKEEAQIAELDLNNFSEAQSFILDTEKLADILKIVCYGWHSDFSFICGETGIRFSWNLITRRIVATEFTYTCNDHIKYIIHCNLSK